MDTIVETGNVHHLGKARLEGCLGTVHTLGDRTGGVVLMAEVLQTFAYLDSFLAPLLGNLVADAPHHDGGMIAVVLYEIDDILIRPFLEEGGIAVLAFGVYPHVETLGHHHHAERIAQLHLESGGHVVGGADGIASHLLHGLDLTDEGSLVFGSTERTEVVV